MLTEVNALSTAEKGLTNLNYEFSVLEKKINQIQWHITRQPKTEAMTSVFFFCYDVDSSRFNIIITSLAKVTAIIGNIILYNITNKI
jgi:hypothetical protein